MTHALFFVSVLMVAIPPRIQADADNHIELYLYTGLFVAKASDSSVASSYVPRSLFQKLVLRTALGFIGLDSEVAHVPAVSERCDTLKKMALDLSLGMYVKTPEGTGVYQWDKSDDWCCLAAMSMVHIAAASVHHECPPNAVADWQTTREAALGNSLGHCRDAELFRTVAQFKNDYDIRMGM